VNNSKVTDKPPRVKPIVDDIPPELVNEEDSAISKPNDIPNAPMPSKTANVFSAYRNTFILI